MTRDFIFLIPEEGISFLFSGGNGIYLDASLTWGKTEHCATFDNPPLCQEGDFKVALIEVYGLNELDI